MVGENGMITEFLRNASYFGVVLCLVTYYMGVWLKKRFKLAILNPLLLAIVMTILTLLVTKVDYPSFNAGARYLSYLLTPATICLAIPLHEQFEILKKNYVAVLCGIFSGVVTSLAAVAMMAMAFALSHEEYVTFLPKSITTAIGIGVCEELGGYTAITAAAIIITGVLGNVIGESVLKLCRVTEPVAKGIAMGTSAHAIGTARAMEMGEVEGALSSLSIVVAGIMTVVLVNLVTGIL